MKDKIEKTISIVKTAFEKSKPFFRKLKPVFIFIKDIIVKLYNLIAQSPWVMEKSKKIKKFFRRLKKKRILALIAVIVCCVMFIKASIKKADIIDEVLIQAESITVSYKYDEALDILNNCKYADSKKIEKCRQEIEEKKSQLVEYTGQFYHVFFHSLIAYPELAFDGDYKHEGYDMWMTTVSEFKAMLPQMYERGFILYPLNEIKAGKKIMLPPGKKPLVISIDDVNYYEYMSGDGFANRLVVDDEGKVACEIQTPEGNMEISYEADVMPILDSFVKEHPDFSFRGAKGVVAVTGYEGAFGYDFESEEKPENEQLRNEAAKVARALKDTGWLIACHSYTHNGYFMDGKVSNEKLHYDTGKFNDRISELVLKPDIYISPYGYHLSEGDERLQYLHNMGYNYFCPVSIAMRTLYTSDDVIIQERFNLDRYSMRNQKKFINETFFDVDSVYYNIP